MKNRAGRSRRAQADLEGGDETGGQERHLAPKDSAAGWHRPMNKRLCLEAGIRRQECRAGALTYRHMLGLAKY